MDAGGSHEHHRSRGAPDPQPDPGPPGPVELVAVPRTGSSRTGLFVGYLVGAGIMIIGGLVEVFLGVNAAGKSLEQITKPLTSVSDTAPATGPAAAPTAA
jgi:hypothetical protein